MFYVLDTCKDLLSVAGRVGLLDWVVVFCGSIIWGGFVLGRKKTFVVWVGVANIVI